MIVARWALLLVASLVALAACGAAATDLQPSALRVEVAAVVALLAPLFWPGCAGTRGRSALRVLAWSAAATLVAAIAVWLFGHGRQPVARLLAPGLLLTALLTIAHAAVAALEQQGRGADGDALRARETAGRMVSAALALAGSLPLWAGPASELLAGGDAGAIDVALASSPLTHLAVASGNDLLRNEWMYAHSNLAALRFTYPGAAALAWCYAAVCTGLALLTVAWPAWGLFAGKTAGGAFIKRSSKR